jgi:hypothetical protein
MGNASHDREGNVIGLDYTLAWCRRGRLVHHFLSAARHEADVDHLTTATLPASAPVFSVVI